MDVNGITNNQAGMLSRIAAERGVNNQGLNEENGINGAEKSKVGGKTIGEPRLSEKGKKYYEELKQKYGNMDFILVSADKKDYAKQMAGSYANPNKMVVLIDEEKIERMAEDEDFRKQYEGLIESAASNIPKLKNAFDGNSNVAGYGMQVNDNGTASFFAIMKKASDDQAARIEEKREEKREEAKIKARKEEKAEQEEKLKEKLEESREERREQFDLKIDSYNGAIEDDDKIIDMFGSYSTSQYEIITASSVDELINMVNGYYGSSGEGAAVNNAHVGANIDFSV
ncbi:MAG: DUF6033 family protein [Lachnospiraceae bacterium]|nr:DUF6033 family protein [Lachnospiraceae bacterium]